MSHATPRARLQQHRDIQQQIHSSDSWSFFNLLTSDALLATVEALLPDHRERLFPPTETLAMFLAQVMSADRSCQQAVNQAAVNRLLVALPTCSTHTGGYCRARQRLPLDMVKALACQLGEMVETQAPADWLWQGRRVLLVDGTTVSMPDTPGNQSVYPQQGGQLPGLGFPICRIVGVTSLASGVLLDAAIGPFNGKGSGEHGLLRELQDCFQPGDVLLGDAFYPTYFFLAEMQARQVDIVMEQSGQRRRRTDFRRGQRLGPRDHLIVLDKPRQKPDWMAQADYDAAPESLTIREFKAAGRILVTTMVKPSKQALGALYQRRWQVELDIRQIKEVMGMNVLSCKTPDMAKKEIWIHLLGYNLIRLLMAQAASLARVRPRDLSFKHCLQLWLSWVHRTCSIDMDMYPALFNLIAQQRVGKRPGRVEPRALKRRPKPYPLLTKPRPIARQQVLEFGHPKKLK
jgi:hypothetical protein